LQVCNVIHVPGIILRHDMCGHDCFVLHCTVSRLLPKVAPLPVRVALGSRCHWPTSFHWSFSPFLFIGFTCFVFRLISRAMLTSRPACSLCGIVSVTSVHVWS
jgi:hypothetical protein